MLHDDVAGYFGFSVQQTCRHQLRRVCENGDDRGWRSSDAWWMCSNQGSRTDRCGAKNAVKAALWRGQRKSAASRKRSWETPISKILKGLVFVVATIGASKSQICDLWKNVAVSRYHKH